MPFLVHAYWDKGSVTISVGAGSFQLLHDSTHPARPGHAYLQPDHFRWRPGLLYIFTFDAGWPSGYRYVQFPPWLVLFVPTLVALAIRREVRYYKRRRLKKLGRMLCPACQYDATGLEACPECGVAIAPAAKPDP